MRAVAASPKRKRVVSPPPLWGQTESPAPLPAFGLTPFTPRPRRASDGVAADSATPRPQLRPRGSVASALRPFPIGAPTPATERTRLPVIGFAREAPGAGGFRHFPSLDSPASFDGCSPVGRDDMASPHPMGDGRELNLLDDDEEEDGARDDDTTANMSDLALHARPANLSASEDEDSSFADLLKPTVALPVLPLPDQSAFNKTWRQANNSSSSSAPSRSPVCPPTPVRTPSWAHVEGPAPLVRKSSLCVSKVLLTLPAYEDSHSGDGSAVFSGDELLEVDDEDEDEDDDDDDDNTSDAAAVGGVAAGEQGSGFGEAESRGPAPRRGHGLVHHTPSHQHQHQHHYGHEHGAVTFDEEFQLLGRLGAGEFSEVFRVLSLTDGRLYAVKRSKRQFRSRRDRDLALAEVRAFQQLDGGGVCANIMQYYRAWQEDGYCFTQAELCERGSLRSLLDALPPGTLVPERTMWVCVADLCRGLNHIHSSGLVHLDIKPQNVFIADDTRLKIGDFGCATEQGNAEDGHEGDNIYMARELLSTAEKRSPADMFSLGIMLFEIATRQDLPQEGQPWHDLREGRVPPLPRSYSAELRRLILQLLNPEPEARPTAADVLALPNVAKLVWTHDRFIELNTRAPTPPVHRRTLSISTEGEPSEGRELHTPTDHGHRSHW